MSQLGLHPLSPQSTSAFQTSPYSLPAHQYPRFLRKKETAKSSSWDICPKMGFRCFHARLHNPWINQEAVPGKRLLGSCLFLSRIAPTKLCLSCLACVAASVTGMNPLEAKKLLDLAFCHSWLLQANLKPKHLALFKD